MSLTAAQRAFATSREPFPAFCGGFGSGKTAAAIARAMALKAHFRECSVAYYLPTFPLVEDIAFQRFPELCERKGWAEEARAYNELVTAWSSIEQASADAGIVGSQTKLDV